MMGPLLSRPPLQQAQNKEDHSISQQCFLWLYTVHSTSTSFTAQQQQSCPESASPTLAAQQQQT